MPVHSFSFSRSFVFFWSSLALFSCAASGTAESLRTLVDLENRDWETRELAPGVDLFQRAFTDLFGGPQFVSLLVVNEQSGNAKVRFAAAPLLGEGYLPTSRIGQQSGAIAAINAGFFQIGRGDPASWNSGLLKIDGRVLPFARSESEEFWFVGEHAVGVDANGKWHFTERGDTWPEDWPDVEHAIAGAHRLLVGGEPHPAVAKPATMTTREARHVGNQHPRTAIAFNGEGLIFLITVDGRHPENALGLTLEDLAKFLQALGAVDALNLDGGGSTAMWIRGEGVVSHPSDNKQYDTAGERAVRTAVVVMVCAEQPPSK